MLFSVTHKKRGPGRLSCVRNQAADSLYLRTAEKGLGTTSPFTNLINSHGRPKSPCGRITFTSSSSSQQTRSPFTPTTVAEHQCFPKRTSTGSPFSHCGSNPYCAIVPCMLSVSSNDERILFDSTLQANNSQLWRPFCHQVASAVEVGMAIISPITPTSVRIMSLTRGS